MPPGEYSTPGVKSERSPLFIEEKGGSRKKPAQLAAWAIVVLIAIGLYSIALATGHDAFFGAFSKRVDRQGPGVPTAALQPRRHSPTGAAAPSIGWHAPSAPKWLGPMPGGMPGLNSGVPILHGGTSTYHSGMLGVHHEIHNKDLLGGLGGLGPDALDKLTAPGVTAIHRQAVLPAGLDGVDPADLERETTPVGDSLPKEDLGMNGLVAHMGRMGVLSAPSGGLHRDLHGHGTILGGALLAGLKSMNPDELDKMTAPDNSRLDTVGVPTRQNPSLFSKPGNPADGDLENEALVWLRSDTGITEDAQGVARWAFRAGVDSLGLRRSFNVAALRPDDAEAPTRRFVAGIPVIEFPGAGADGSTGLRVDPELMKIPQPFMIVAVANPAGDATVVANGGTEGPHLELCHGFPENGNHDPRVALVASGEGEDPPDPPAQILHGKTRDTRAWHVYTVVVDGPRTELYVDGALEGSGDPGPNGLNGLSVGADPWGTFGMRGGLLELLVIPGVPTMEARFALELRLATRYQPVFAASPVPHHRTW